MSDVLLRLATFFTLVFMCIGCLRALSALTHAPASFALNRRLFFGAIAAGLMVVFPVFLLERLAFVFIQPHLALSPFPLVLVLIVTLPSWFGKLCAIFLLMRHRRHTLSIRERFYTVFSLCLGVYVGQLLLALVSFPVWNLGLVLHEIVQLLGHVTIGVTLGVGVAYWESTRRGACRCLLIVVIPLGIGWTRQMEVVQLHHSLAQSLYLPLSQISEHLAIAGLYLFVSYFGVVKLRPGH